MAVRPTQLLLEYLEAREVPAVGLDPTYGTNGYVLDPAGTQGLFQSVAGAVAAPGGQVVVIGNAPGTAGTTGAVELTRLTGAGAVDPTFGTNGVVTLNFSVAHAVTAVTEQADGKILIGGTFGNPSGTQVTPDVFVLRLNADGTRDTTFGTGGETDFTLGGMDTLSQLAVAPDGSIVFAGVTSWGVQVGEPVTDSLLVLGRLTPNGAPDTSFGYPGDNGLVRVIESGPWNDVGLAVQPDGKIVLAWTTGPFDQEVPPTNPTKQLIVFRYDTNGLLDTTFGTNGSEQPPATGADETVGSVAVLSNGEIVVAGSDDSGTGVLDWFGGTGTFLGTSSSVAGISGTGAVDWFGNTNTFLGASPSAAGISSQGPGASNLVVAAPDGGVDVIGTVGADGTGGLAVDHQTGPGAATDSVVVHPGGFAAPAAALVNADGSLLVVGPTAGDGYPSDAAPPELDLARFTDPGTTTSTTTFVQPEWTAQPAGTVSLAAQVLPLLGSEPVTGGTITFREGTTVLGTMTAGFSSAPPSTVLAPGDYTVTVAYSGTAQWSSSSAAYTLHVTPNSTATVGVTVSDTNPAVGEPLTFTAQVRAPLVSNPGGTVTFYVNGGGVGTVPLSASGTAQFTLPSGLPLGPYAISATFDAPAAGLSGESSFVEVNVSRAFPAVVLTASATGALSAGEPVALTATVAVPTSTGVTPTGTVTFYAGSTVLGTAAVGATGTATLTTTGLVPGTAVLRASYSGDADVQGEMSAPLRVTVGRAVTTTALTVPSGPVASGQPVTLTATVRATGGFPIGSVEFLDGTTVLGTAFVNGRGEATLARASLAAGPHSITAVYSGSSMCGTSTSAPQTVTVSGTPGVTATTTTLTTSVAAPVFGRDQTLTATVVTATGPAKSGTVAFYDGQTLLGSVAVDANGTAALAAALNLGSHPLRAVYTGSAGLASRSSAQLTETVAKAPTTVTLSRTANALRATVRPVFGGSPIGTVTFMEGTTALGIAQVNGNGLAVLPLGTLPTGIQNLTAVYSGSSCFVGATAPALDSAS